MAVSKNIKRVDRHYYKGDNDLIYKSRTLSFFPYAMSDVNINYLMIKIREALNPSLLKYEDRKKNLENNMYGHCYHATQALYYLLQIREPLDIYKGLDDDGEYHWWLKRERGNVIYDVTANRYLLEGKKPPYDKGEKTTWKGIKKRPLEETLNLMILVLKNDQRKFQDVITLHEKDQELVRDF